eukprot:10816095-Alexandrium_andersonii.AAC.1
MSLMHVRHCDYLAVHFNEVRQSVSLASLRSPHGSLFHPSRSAERQPPVAAGGPQSKRNLLRRPASNELPASPAVQLREPRAPLLASRAPHESCIGRGCAIAPAPWCLRCLPVPVPPPDEWSSSSPALLRR